MRFLLALACVLAPRQPAYVPWFELIDQAKWVVVGEVVDFGRDQEGRRVAILRVDEVWKGKCEEQTLVIPFKTEITWPCDFTIEYERRKYLLLIDDRAYYRVVYYAAYTHHAYEGPQDVVGRFTRAVVNLRSGVECEKAFEELESLASEAIDSIIEFSETLPRAVVRPLLPTLRKAHAPRMEGLSELKGPDRWRELVILLNRTRDFRLFTEFLAWNGAGEPWPILQALSRTAGRRFDSLAEARRWWARAQVRSRAYAAPGKAAQLIVGLRSADPAERASAEVDLLDLGPDILETVRSHARPGDPRLDEIVQELEVLRDLRADVSRDCERPPR